MISTQITFIQPEDDEEGPILLIVDGETLFADSFEEAMSATFAALQASHGEPDEEFDEAYATASNMLEVVFRDALRQKGITAPLDLTQPISFTPEQEDTLQTIAEEYKANLHADETGKAHLHGFKGGTCVGCLCKDFGVLLPPDVARHFEHEDVA
jgi:hypothetical protein